MYGPRTTGIEGECIAGLRGDPPRSLADHELSLHEVDAPILEAAVSTGELLLARLRHAHSQPALRNRRFLHVGREWLGHVIRKLVPRGMLQNRTHDLLP